MDMSDEIVIAAPRAKVYAALNDQAILQASIPGCEELIKHSDTDLEAKVVLKIGPVKARFAGKVTLDQTGAPDRFTLKGEGNGGIAGFAKGGAEVELIEQDGGTLLRYTATADVGGKIAQLGSRLILGTAKKLAAQFFDDFALAVTGEAAPAEGAA